MTELMRRFAHPSVYSNDLFDRLETEIFDQFHKMAYPKSGVPYDVVENYDDDAKVLQSTDIVFALAGYDVDDIKVKVEDGILTVSAQKTVEEDNKNKKYRQRGLSSRSFSQSFRTHEISPSDVTAEYTNGQLVVNVKHNIPQKEVFEIPVKSDTKLLDSKKAKKSS
jgi:HSP20 family protein